MSISYLNSLTPRNVVSGFVFNGVYDDILSASQITVRVTNTFATSNYTLSLQYSNDKVNVVNTETLQYTNTDNNLLYFTPTSRYFKLTFTLTSGNLDNLSIETIFKHAIVYKPFVAITGSVTVDNLPASNGDVNIIQSIPLGITNTGFTSNIIASVPLGITNTGFTSNIIASVPLGITNTGFTSNIIASVPLGITNTGFTSNIIASVPLEISNLGFTSNIIASVPLEISNLGFTSNIIASVELDVNVKTLPAELVLDTNISSIDNTVTFLTQERPTTETFFTTTAGNAGIWISGSTKVIRNMSINTTGSVIVYVYLYDIVGVPDNTSVPTFVFTVKDSNNVVFNPLDHKFVNGLSVRATTTYNGVISPALNSLFINMTLSD